MRNPIAPARTVLVLAFAVSMACGKAPDPLRTESAVVEPVDISSLQASMPEVAGWARGKPTGERMTRPVRYAHVTAKYTKADAEIEAKVTDSAMNPQLLAPLTWMTNTSYARTSADGFERAASIDGYPGFETWNATSKTGEVDVVVGRRFIVEVEGRQVADLADLRTFLASVDLHALGGRK